MELLERFNQNQHQGRDGQASAAREIREKFKTMSSNKLSPQFWNISDIFINDIISHFAYTSYLEIGIGEGLNFARVRCETKVSVDISPGNNPISTPMHVMSSDDFFAMNESNFDLVFIDGAHHSEQVIRDIENSLSVLNSNGMILCHDVNPGTEEMQIVPRVQSEWTGDCWKAWVRCRSTMNDLSMLTLDVPYGMGVIAPGASPNPLDPIHEANLTWPNFVANREKWLNLVSLGQAAELLLHVSSAHPGVRR